MEQDLSNIHIVMVATTHPGNIGGVARAMKNMGLSKLSLVAPETAFPHPKAKARASGAVDILNNIKVYTTLAEAVAGSTLVIGSSARMRTLPLEVVSPRECAERAINLAKDSEVAIVLGRENSGLSNEELEQCQLIVTIPTNPDFSSLNIAAAAQVFCYELRLAATVSSAEDKSEHHDSPLATAEEREGMFRHFEEALTEIGFLNPKSPGMLMRRLRRLFSRTGLEQLEINVLRGIMKAAVKAKEKGQSKEPDQ